VSPSGFARPLLRQPCSRGPRRYTSNDLDIVSLLEEIFREREVWISSRGDQLADVHDIEAGVILPPSAIGRLRSCILKPVVFTEEEK
jgi:hypothetical protein